MKIMRIDQVCEVNPSKATNLDPNTTISFVPMDSVSTTGHINLDKTIPVGKVKNYSVFRNGDIIFAKITPCMENGKGAIVTGLKEGYAAGSTEFIVLRPNTDIIQREWLYLFLAQKSFRLYCQQHTTGSAGQKRVPPKFLGACEIPIPSIQEQQCTVSRIEELFSNLDEALRTLREAKQQLIKYRRAVVKYYLSESCPLSIEWEQTTVGQVCDCLDNMRKPVKKDKRSTGSGKYPYYGANGRTGSIDNYIFDEELVLVVEDETFTGRIRPFSYIINGKSWVNNHAHILRGKTGVLDNHFLNYILAYYPFLPMVTGTTGRKIVDTKGITRSTYKNMSLFRTEEGCGAN